MVAIFTLSVALSLSDLVPDRWVMAKLGPLILSSISSPWLFLSSSESEKLSKLLLQLLLLAPFPNFLSLDDLTVLDLFSLELRASCLLGLISNEKSEIVS